MIDSLTVWHGPVFAMYSQGPKDMLADLSTLTIACAETAVTDMAQLLPEDSILADDRNGLWLRGIDAWKADDVTKAIKFLTKHALHFDVAVTSDKAPVKSVRDVAVAVHSFDVPKSTSDYARQIEDWLLVHGRALDKGVAAKLIDHCSPEPEVPQRVVATLAASPGGGRVVTWEQVEAIVGDLIQEKVPLWRIGTAVSTGDTEAALEILRSLGHREHFGILRYLENRYRLLLLVTAHTPTSKIVAVFPNTNDWVIKKTMSEARGTTPRLCALALADINATFDLLMSNIPGDAAATAVEQCAIKLTARHRMAMNAR